MVFDAPEDPVVAPDLPSSEALASGLRAYAGQRWEEAAGHLTHVLDGQTSDGLAGRRRAELTFAKSLHSMGLHHASAAAFDVITREGRDHPHFAETLLWLGALAEHLPEPSWLIEQVGRYHPDELRRLDHPTTRAVYDHLLYLLGRHRYDQRQLGRAIALFRRVRPNTRWYVPARFYLGVSHVRSRRARPGVAAFREVIASIEDGRAGDLEDEDRMRDLAWLSLGRLYYTAANDGEQQPNVRSRLLDAALTAWNRVPEESEYWLDSMFEKSWALFIAEEDGRALGRIHAIQSPYFERHHLPEAQVLKAVIYFQHCHLAAAEEAVETFHSRYGPVLADLRRTMRESEDHERSYRLLVHARNGRNIGGTAAGIVRDAFGDRELLRHLAQVRSLDGERARITSVTQSTSLQARLAQELAIGRAMAVDRTGELARLRLQRLVSDLQDRANEMDSVLVEIHTARRTRGVERRDAEPPGIYADQEHQIWPFDGEYWRDELPYYRQILANRCTR